MSETLNGQNNILFSHKDGKTSFIFTEKALFHILEQHSESDWCEEARKINKIYFKDEQEIIGLAKKIVETITSEIEYQRACWNYIPYIPNKINQVYYYPFSKNIIIQFRQKEKNSFEIISFYHKNGKFSPNDKRNIFS